MKILRDVVKTLVNFWRVHSDLIGGKGSQHHLINFCDFPEKVSGENHGDPHYSLVSVRVEIGIHFPLVDDVLTKLLLAFVQQLYRIELSENVVRPRDVVVQPAVLECWF